HEQVGYVVSGRYRQTIAGTIHELHPGDSYAIPGGIEHAMEVLEDGQVIDRPHPAPRRVPLMPHGLAAVVLEVCVRGRLGRWSNERSSAPERSRACARRACARALPRNVRAF